MKKLTLLTTLALVGGPGVAFAQNSATTGFPIGEKSRLHTNLEMAVGFDSNSQRFDNNALEPTLPADGQKSDWRALIRPGILLNVPGNSVIVSGRAQVTINQYFGTGTAPSDTTFGGDLGASLQLGPSDTFLSFKLEDQLVRTPTLLDEQGSIASDERRFREWNNKGTARVTLRPGGRALELDIGYLNEMQWYDELPRSHKHGGLIEARWKFLPKTALMFHADLATFQPAHDESNTTFKALPLHITLGLVGQVTAKLTAELTAGYEDTLTSESSASSRGPVGNAVLTYQMSEQSAFTLGYRRRVLPVVVLNSYSSDAPFAQAKYAIPGGRMIFSLFGQLEFRTYGASPTQGRPESAGVMLLTGDARVEYWFFEFLNASLNYRVQWQNPSDTASMLGTVLVQDFSRHQLMLNIGLRY